MNPGAIINKLLPNLSFLKAAGIDNLVFIEFYPSLVKFVALKRNEPFYRLKNSFNNSNFEIIASEFHAINSISSDVSKLLIEFNKKYNLQNSFLGAGINEFKFKTISVPNDIEDIDAWINEKSNSFLPDGCSKSDFSFSFEEYNVDENNKYFYLSIVRADLIKKIHDACCIEKLNLINISPFSLALFNKNLQPEKNYLYLDFTDSRISYTLVNTPGQIINGEFYLQQDAKKIENYDSFQNSISEFYLTLSTSVGENRLQNLNLFLCCKQNEFSFINNSISSLFNIENTNSNFPRHDSYFLGSYLAYNKLFSDFDTQINYFNDDIKGKQRFLFEKSLSMRFVLAVGVVLIFLLLLCSVSESLINSQLKAEEENILMANTTTAQLESLKKEGAKLSANLVLLHSLKDKRCQYSNLIYALSNVVTSKSNFISVESKSLDMNLIALEIVGAVASQQDIAAIISNLEHSPSFKDVSLLFSSEQNQNDNPSVLKNMKSLKFSISVKYDLNKK